MRSRISAVEKGERVRNLQERDQRATFGFGPGFGFAFALGVFRRMVGLV